MTNIVDYIRARLAEEGTKRSLAVVLFSIAGAGNSQALWEAAIYLLTAALGAWSAAQPSKVLLPNEVAVVPPATGTTTTTVTQKAVP